MRSVFAVVLPAVMALIPQVASPRAATHDLNFADVIPDAGARSGPESLAWNHDGTRLGYLYDDGDGLALWVLVPGEGSARSRLADEVLDAGIDAFHWSPVNDTLLLESDGDLFLLPAAESRPRRLTRTDAEESSPRFSGDGARIAFVRDHDLHLLDLSDGEIRPLTRDGEADFRLNGETDWIYWEEIWGRDSTGFWWSPDGQRIAFYQFDETPVETYPLLDTAPHYPVVKRQKYPKAGTANPRVRIGVITLSNGDIKWLETGRNDGSYLARVHWHPDSRSLVVERLNREQDRLDLLTCDARRGRCRTLHTETWPTWVNLGNDFAFLDDGSFVRGSERSGWRRLDLHGPDGRLQRTLTPDGWVMTSLDGLDEERGWAMVTGFRSEEGGARERHVLRVPLGEGHDLETYTEGRGWSSALVAPESGSWVHTWSTADTPTVRTVRGAGMGAGVELPSGPPPAFDPESLPRWEFFAMTDGNGQRLPASLLKPPGFDPERTYPVIMYHYGGPGSQVVADRWGSRGRSIWHKMMAQRGFIVLSVDNPASIFFGKKGEDLQHRRFGEINLAAQKTAVGWLKAQPWVDGSRIGLWGWSGGGANTLYCLFNAPGLWRAGVAGAPVTDWLLYDTIWTERYLDHPADNAAGYQASSPLTHAAHLEDALLIIHGTADDNVHPQNSLNLVAALVEHEKMFQVALYPGQKHSFRGLSARHFYRRMSEFFQRELGGDDTAAQGSD